MAVFGASKLILNVNNSIVLAYLRATGSKRLDLIRASVTSRQATNQQLDCYLARLVSIGSGGTNMDTDRYVEATGISMTATAKAGIFTTEPGTSGVLYRESHHAMAGWHFTPMEDERIRVNGGVDAGLALVLANVPVQFDAVVQFTWDERD